MYGRRISHEIVRRSNQTAGCLSKNTADASSWWMTCRIAGADGTGKNFFHTPTPYTARGQIILTSDRPPSKLPSLRIGSEADLGRHDGGHLGADFELRAAIVNIKSQALARGALDAAQLIAANITE
jgi:chromosomal replication initiation ATPase DnaA